MYINAKLSLNSNVIIIFESSIHLYFFYMFKKWIYKKGPGSVGQSSQLLANEYRLFSEMKKPSSNIPIFEMMYDNRRMLNQRFPTSGDILQRLPFNIFHDIICDDKEDLSLFIFKILYHESDKFRRNLHNVDEKTCHLILEVIYESIGEIAPYGITMEKKTFIESASKSMHWWKMNPLT